MKKRIVSLLMAGILAAAALTGCGNGEGTGGTEDQGVGESTPEEIVVRYMCFGTVPTDLQAVEDAINEITVPEINVKIDYQAISASNYGTQLALDMTSGEKVDVFYNMDFINSVKNNQVLDLSEYLDEYGQDLVEQTTETWLEATTVDGGIYGVPTVNGKAASLVIAMRKDILEKYGLMDQFETITASENILDDTAQQTLQTIADIYEVVCANEPDMIGLCAGGAGTLNLEQMINYDSLTDSNGVLMGNEGWEVEDLYETEEFYSMLETLRDWYLAGYIKSDVATDTESYLTYAKAGRMFSVLLSGDETVANQLQRDSGYEYVAVRIKTPLITSDALSGQCWSVSATTDVPEAAVKFMNLAYSNKDIANLMCYGVEGKHWQYAEDGTVAYADGVDATTSGYPMTTYWEMPNSIIADTMSGNPEGYNEQLAQLNKEAATSRALGFSFDSSEVETELTAISAVGSKYMTGFYTGSVDLEENYDAFLEEMKNAGLDTIIEEKQRQIDEWQGTGSAE